jgi:hypothetical protein
VHLNRTIGAVVGTEAAADAPVLDDHLTLVAAMDRADRAADRANRVEAGTAGRRDQVLVEARSGEVQPAVAVVMRPGTGADALVAASAAIQVDEHQALPLDQPQLVEAPGRQWLASALLCHPGQRGRVPPAAASDLEFPLRGQFVVTGTFYTIPAGVAYILRAGSTREHLRSTSVTTGRCSAPFPAFPGLTA